ncbi:hypothetical protein BCR33DRAFT_233121 [Rhizoclosmatium globosum]|uniref:Uncharacterized protein n=1 Tax=Rhizoclosmatium globosum TaxID=329046 RepID=A0A1Y2CAX7_9FUNG|nr:hypothetical protein BCR33DRAFT_233121 [Rhizoclosmatium globosum]|eukprot:ORY44004.1 hypothetical protein BCR33DRAFT_233121 [Rhizoclosmatium globosum]
MAVTATNSETWRVSVYAITGPEPKPTLWIDYPAKNVDVLSTRTHLNQFVRYKMVQGSKITFTFAVDHYGNQLPELLVLTEYGGRLAMEEKEFPSSAIIYNVTHRGSASDPKHIHNRSIYTDL